MKAIIKEKLLKSDMLSDDIKTLLKEGKSKLNYSLLDKQYLCSLYEFRLERLGAEPNYKDLVKELKLILSKIQNSKDENTYIISIITKTRFLDLFYDSKIHSLYGVLDFTGKGNTSAFLISI